LWFEYPAEQWNSQAFHLGNGFLGASFYGGVKEERFDLTEKSIWTGGPGQNPDYSYGNKIGGKDHLADIRNAIVTGNVEEADKLVARHFLGDYSDFGAFSMIGNLYFAFDNHDTSYTNYIRELDLSKSLARVAYEVNSVKYQREYFCSYPDRVLVMRFHSDVPGELGFTMRLAVTQKNHSVTVDGNLVEIAGKIDGNNRDFRVKIKVLNTGGIIETDGKIIQVKDANTATVILVAATEYLPDPPMYNGADPNAFTTGIIHTALKKSYKQLKESHIKDYQLLYKRVQLNLAGDPLYEKLPTNQRWENFKDGSKDIGLKTLAFNLGRYLIISTSRPGSLPSNLQGVWNTFDRAPWNGNYQSNINLQLMYMPCGPVNLLECQIPYIDWIKGLVVPGRETAKKYYGTNGWISHTTGNIWGYTAPGVGLLWGIYPVGGVWHCQHLWEQYTFTMDKEYLEEEAYPVMKEATEFWLANLIPYKEGLISAPTVSAEHGVETTNGKYIDPTMSAERGAGKEGYRFNIPGAYQDIEMIWDLFSNVLEAADALGINGKFLDSVKAAREKLIPLKIGRYGQLQEWFEDIDSPEDHHRHMAHLYAVHPGRQIHPLTTPDLAEAARKSLNIRGDGVFPGWLYSGGNWARAWRIYCWSRLLDGERANKIFSELISEQGFENLMTFQHVPGSKRMQVDASMSTPGFVAEMLLQSHLGEIHILPALPSDWPEGKVEGLLARGGYEIEIEWEQGHLKGAEIKSLKGGIPIIRVEGKLIDPDKDQRVKLIK